MFQGSFTEILFQFRFTVQMNSRSRIIALSKYTKNVSGVLLTDD